MFPKQASVRKSKLVFVVPVAMMAVILIVSVACFYYYSTIPRPDAGKYQAVFLSNGQVYFGKLSGINSRNPILEDVFYLQVNQSLQQGVESVNASASGTPAIAAEQPKFSLMKLGQSEIHGPEDRLFLMKQQVLFWENLRSDSQVVKTIEDFRTREVR